YAADGGADHAVAQVPRVRVGGAGAELFGDHRPIEVVGVAGGRGGIERLGDHLVADVVGVEDRVVGGRADLVDRVLGAVVGQVEGVVGGVIIAVLRAESAAVALLGHQPAQRIVVPGDLHGGEGRVDG